MQHAAALPLPRGDLRPARRRTPRDARRASSTSTSPAAPAAAAWAARRRRRSPAGPGWPPRRPCPTSRPPSWRPCPRELPGAAAAARARLARHGAAAGAARRRASPRPGWPGRRSAPGTARDERPGARGARDRRLEPRRRGRVPGRRRRPRGSPPARCRSSAPSPPCWCRSRWPTSAPVTCTPTARSRTCCSSPGSRSSPTVAWRGRRRRRRAVCRPAGARVRRASALLLALLAGLAARRRRHGRPGGRARRRWCPPTRGRAPGWTRCPAEVTLEFSEGVSLGAGYARVLGADGDGSTPATAAVDGGVLTIPLRGGPAATTATWSPTGSSRPTRTPSPARTPSSSATASSCRPARRPAEDPTDPVVAAALPAARWVGFAGLALAIGVPVLALRVLARRAGRRHRLRRLAACGRRRGRRRRGRRSFLLQGPYAAGSGLGVASSTRPCSRPRLGSEAGWALLARARPRRSRCALALRPVWRRGDAAVAGRARRRRGCWPLGLVVSTAAIGHPVAGPWPALAVAVADGARRRHGRLARRPRRPPRRRAPAGRRPADDARRGAAPLLPAGLRRGRRRWSSAAPCRPCARWSRRRRCSRTTYGWVLIAKLVLVAGRCWPPPGSPGSGCSSGSASGAPGPAAAAALTAHAFAASAPEAGAAGADAVGGRPPARAARCSRRAPPSTCPRCAGRSSWSSPSPPSSWRCPPSWSAPRPPGRPSPSRST